MLATFAVVNVPLGGGGEELIGPQEQHEVVFGESAQTNSMRFFKANQMLILRIEKFSQSLAALLLVRLQ